MIRRSLVIALAAIFTVSLSACDTVTDLGTVTLEGRWEGQGALQASLGTVRLTFFSENEDGSFVGSWSLPTTQHTLSGSIESGSNNNGIVQFTMNDFYGGGPVTFSGELQDRFTIKGDLQGFDLGDEAVFRLVSTRTS